MTAQIIPLDEHRRARAARAMTVAVKAPVAMMATLFISAGIFMMLFGFAGLYLMQGRER